MRKRSFKRLITLLVIFSFVFSYAVIPVKTNAASLTNASDTLSDSDLSVAATSTFAFMIGTNLVATDYIDIVYPGTFGTVATTSIDCSGVDGAATASTPTTRTARCTVGGAIATSSTLTIIVAGVTNPSSVSYPTITIGTYDSGDAVKETANVMVAIVDDVTVYATVSATLEFTISGTVTSTVINSATTTGATATTTIDFGGVAINSAEILGQELRVSTNAADGYTVTVEQSQNLTNASLEDIDSFKDSVASTTSQTWTVPAETLDDETTYGHFGVISNDTTLSTNQFAADTWKGFDSSTPMEVMYHTGPADGSTQNKGLAQVGYKIEISALQEAGDYTNILTYICTPTY